VSVQYTRPLPVPTPLSQPFWTACKERRLLAQRCARCGGHVFIPRAFCPRCLGPDLAWVPVLGSGVVVTYTVVWRAQTPAFETPYVIAVVRLDEGHEMMTNLVDADVATVRIGMRVQVRFVDVSAEITLPCFAPLAGARVRPGS
jgi:uncharacterized OB-fold protein